MQPVTAAVAGELALALLLSPFWEADLRRPWANVLGASDASTDFGFGFCAAQVSPDLSRRIGRAADKGDCFARLQRDQTEAEEPKERRGVLHRVPLRKRDFRTVLSVRNKRPAHIGSLETTALLLLVQWLLRKTENHGKRTPVCAGRARCRGKRPFIGSI